MRSIPGRVTALVALAALGTLIGGCGGGGAPPADVPAVTFAQAREGGVGIHVAGQLEPGSLRQATGEPTRFTLRERSTRETLDVEAGQDVSVPANLISAKEVRLTGTWDTLSKRFNASEVVSRVPNRDEQLHN